MARYCVTRKLFVQEEEMNEIEQAKMDAMMIGAMLVVLFAAAGIPKSRSTVVALRLLATVMEKFQEETNLPDPKVFEALVKQELDFQYATLDH